MNRTVGIILTVVTVLCCACPGFGLCIGGAMVAAGVPIKTTLNGVETSQIYPASYGIVLLCLALIFIVIPIVVAFFTFRNKPAAAPVVVQDYNGPIPPTS